MGALGESHLDEVFPSSSGDGGEPVRGSTEQRALRATLAAYAIQLARLLVTFGAKLVLMRLVLPEGHGVYELALRIVTVASAIRDLGLPYHLIRDERRPYGTVLIFTVFSGSFLTLALIAIAPLFGQLTPELPSVLRVFAVWILLDGLAVVPRAFFERELTISGLVAPEIWRSVVIGVLSVGLAWFGWGYWSFIIADLVGASVLALYSWLKAWGKVPLSIQPHLLPDLIRRSFLLFLIWISLQLVTYIDAFIVEAHLDTAVVGLYARSYGIVFLVANFVYPRALFPTLVEYIGDRDRFAEFFRLSTIQLLGCQVLAGYFLFCNADRVVYILFGREWSAAIPILRALAFVPFFDQFTILGGEMLKARHRDREWLLIELINLGSLVFFGLILIRRLGAPGMAMANYLLLGNILMAWEMIKALGVKSRRLFVDLLTIYAVPLPFFFLVTWLTPVGSWSRLWVSLGATTVAAVVIVLRYLSAYRLFFGRASSR